MFCTNCGTQNPEDAGFCVKCGAKLVVDEPAQQAQQSPTLPSSSAAQQYTAQQHTPQPHQAPFFPQKRKSTAPFIVLGIVGVLFGLFVLVGVIGLITDSQDGSSSSRQVSSTAVSSAITASSEANDKVELTQTYFNSNEGIYFQYPGDWEKIPESDWNDYLNDSDGVIAFLARPDTSGTLWDAFFILLEYEAEEGAEESLFSDDNTFLDVLGEPSAKKTSVTEIDGIPAREVTYVDEEGNGSQHYYYIIGSKFYKVEIDWIGEDPGDLQQTFDAIMDSYAIDEDKLSSGTSSDDGVSSGTSSSSAPVGLELPEGLEWVEPPAVVKQQGWAGYIEGIIRNTSGAPAKVSIGYHMYDADGNQMNNQWDSINDLQNGNTWKFSVYVPSEATSYEFIEVRIR